MKIGSWTVSVGVTSFPQLRSGVVRILSYPFIVYRWIGFIFIMAVKNVDEVLNG